MVCGLTDISLTSVELETKRLLEEKQILTKEQSKWKKRLEDTLKKPEKAILSKKTKPIKTSSQSSVQISFTESFSSELEEGERDDLSQSRNLPMSSQTQSVVDLTPSAQSVQPSLILTDEADKSLDSVCN